MRGFVRGALLPAALALCLLAVPAAVAKEVPYLAGRVTDEAGMIPAGVEQRIDAALARFEDETGSQVAVLTVESLEGEPLEDYALRVAETWELGREGVDDGVLLLIAERDRKLRLEVGYGLEDELTDLESGRIIRNVITPRFKQGDFGAGVEEGVTAILGTLRDEPGAIPDEPPPGSGGGGGSDLDTWWEKGFVGLIFFTVIGVFSLQALFNKGCQSWFLYFFLMPFYFSFPLFILGTTGGLVLAFAWVLAFPLLKLFFRGTERGRRWVSSGPIVANLSRWARTSGSSGGGFSGGGGSFGGGGASGSW